MKEELPPLFEGATHRRNGVEPVKAVRWKRDGDHPKVDRYPIEKRDFKGILVVDEKTRFALRFGEWILEDAKGRLWVESFQELPAEYEPLEPPAPTPATLAILALLVVSCLVAGLWREEPSYPIVFAVTHLMYYSALLGQWNGLANAVFDLDTDDVRVAATTNTYTPNQDTHDFFDDVTNEVSGSNYPNGTNNTLQSPTLTRSTGTVTFDAADVVWLQHATGFSNARKFVLRKHNATAGNARLFSVVTADADVGNVTGDLTLAWHTSGIATWTTT